jgi:hypothetical protein
LAAPQVVFEDEPFHVEHLARHPFRAFEPVKRQPSTEAWFSEQSPPSAERVRSREPRCCRTIFLSSSVTICRLSRHALRASSRPVQGAPLIQVKASRPSVPSNKPHRIIDVVPAEAVPVERLHPRFHDAA